MKKYENYITMVLELHRDEKLSASRWRYSGIAMQIKHLDVGHILYTGKLGKNRRWKYAQQNYTARLQSNFWKIAI